MKYFVYTAETGLEEMIVFCETAAFNHADVARSMGVLDAVISAGFITFTPEGIHCGGHSDTINRALGKQKNSRGGVDEAVFKRHNSLSGVEDIMDA